MTIRFTPNKSAVRFTPALEHTSHGATGSWEAPTALENVQHQHPSLNSALEFVPRIGKGAVDAAAGTASGLYHAAIDPSTEKDTIAGHQLPFTLRTAKRLVVDPSLEEFEKLKGVLQEDPSGPPTVDRVTRGLGHIAGMVPVVGPLASHLYQTARDRSIPEALGEAAGGYLMGKALSRAHAEAPTAIEKASGLPVKAGEAAATVAGKAVDLVTGTPLQPEKIMVKAIKPRAGNLQFESGLDRAMPELKNVERITGKPITNVDELIEGTKTAKKNIWDQYERIQGPQSQRGLSGNDVATAIEKSIPLKTKIQKPALAEKLQGIADSYRNRSFKVAELEDLLHTTNAELDAFYDKYPTAKRTLAASSPDTAHLVAEGKALRDTIYNALDQAGGGAAPRELKQRYGSLLNLEEEAYRRRNVAARQQPESLTEQMGRLHAGFKVAKGALQIFPGLDPAGGISEIGSAVAGRKLGRAIKEANSTDRLIKVALERYRGEPSPIDYTPVKPKALLGPGAFRMGPVPEGETMKVGTVPWESLRPPQRKALPSASTDLRATVKYGPTGPYEMPPVPPKLLTEGQKMLPAHETPAYRSKFGDVGKALAKGSTEQAVNQAVESRLGDIKAVARSGATEMTGKTKRAYFNPDNPLDTGKVEGRFGGGFKKIFPELEGFKEPPSRIADAIERDQGNPLYLKLKKAITPNISEEVANQQESSFDFGANAPAKPRRGSLLEQIRRMRAGGR